MQTIIVSAFPGTGKTYATENTELALVDLESSNFSWLIKGEKRNPDFPQNYIEHVKGQMGKCEIIFVSSHQEVRDALTENGIPFLIVHPLRGDKVTYIQRFIDRGDNENFVNMMDEKWDEYIDSMCEYKNYGEIAIVLLRNEYLDTYIPHMLNMGRTNKDD